MVNEVRIDIKRVTWKGEKLVKFEHMLRFRYLLRTQKVGDKWDENLSRYGNRDMGIVIMFNYSLNMGEMSTYSETSKKVRKVSREHHH